MLRVLFNTRTLHSGSAARVCPSSLAQMRACAYLNLATRCSSTRLRARPRVPIQCRESDESDPGRRATLTILGDVSLHAAAQSLQTLVQRDGYCLVHCVRSAAVPSKRGAASQCERARQVQPLAVRLLQIQCRQRRGEPGLVRLRLLRGFVVRASWI